MSKKKTSVDEIPKARGRKSTRPDHTEDLVDLLAEQEPTSSSHLASFLGLPGRRVREELIKLEALGIVYRTGSRRGTKWHLG